MSDDDSPDDTGRGMLPGVSGLVDAAQVEILRWCPEATAAHTRAVRRALNRLGLDAYVAGKERGEADAAERLRQLMACIGPAYLTALARLEGRTYRMLATPTAEQVRTYLNAGDVVGGHQDVVRLCAAAGLKLSG